MALEGPELAEHRATVSEEGLTRSRQQLARVLLRALVVVGVLVVAIGSYAAYTSEYAWQILVYVGIYVALVVVTFWRRVSYQVQVVTVVLLLLGMATFNLTQFGINAESAAFFAAVPFVTAIFFGRRGGIASIAVVLLIFGQFGEYLP